MKTIVATALTVLVLGSVLVLAFGTRNAGNTGPAVAWDGDLATITWTETLADPKAEPNETPFSLLSGPVLGWLTEKEASLSWEVIAEKSLTAKPYASLPGAYPADKLRFRSIQLTGLKPDTEYRYQLKSGNFASKVFKFRTLPPNDATAFRFALIGDTQRGAEVPESAEIERKLFALIHAWNPALFLHLGDMLETGRGDGINGRKNWYRALERYKDPRASVFMAPTAGNHCWSGKGHGWYADYFADVKGRAATIKDGSQPPFYYAFDVANVHFVSLCTEAVKTSGKNDVADKPQRDLPFTYNEQLAWFENDLKNAKATWKVVFFHAPFHTAGPHPAPTNFRQDFGSICDKYGVQLVCSGHDHSYQKTKRMTNVERKVSDTGTVQVISGGGDIRQFDRVKNPPDWNLFHRKVNHYVQVDVNAERLQFTAVDVKGEVFDVWRLPLQGQPVPMEFK